MQTSILFSVINRTFVMCFILGADFPDYQFESFVASMKFGSLTWEMIETIVPQTMVIPNVYHTFF